MCVCAVLSAFPKHTFALTIIDLKTASILFVVKIRDDVGTSESVVVPPVLMASLKIYMHKHTYRQGVHTY